MHPRFCEVSQSEREHHMITKGSLEYHSHTHMDKYGRPWSHCRSSNEWFRSCLGVIEPMGSQAYGNHDLLSSIRTVVMRIYL